MSDITAMATGSKALAELFLAEKMLAKAGKDVEEDHPLGDAGGDREPPRMNNYVKRKFVIKEGINRFGKPVQEQHLTTEGDERAIREVEAEREARDAIEDMW
ncbi:hypothetical protein [uncultured Rhodospira sp.]|uniref:hypothetical protein n=1 Tax=uncultured Rhodospira sp. TaxID=1936189 RepID=UPI0026020CDA|nr:hypothetical protein [uncultured Rhodospira sp.]